jgi:ATP-binding cassette subfamily F protein 3
MIEMTADRLVLVDNGTARDFDGSVDDYIAMILGKEPPAKAEARGGEKKSGFDRDQLKGLRQRAKAAENDLAKLTEQRDAVDRALADPAKAAAPVGDLMKRRAELDAAVEAAEAAWMEATEALETMAA